ncbi:hypothetical protein Patl1_31237 [Pistacia atlantica]|uniref:Uncharacterized protein n=1 Tax=Pistacia atlantica TaxID=434234 RepID=A0ACC1AEK5_9ROSI|nr:hypothetical protein Patl1_31237 [Pistacia atlantica]
MAAKVESNVPFEIEFPRNVKNVGIANSNYNAEVSKNSQIDVTVKPSILSFTSLYEKKSFVVTVSGKGLQQSMVSTS